MTTWDLPGTLRRIRRVVDLSQRELARQLGMSKSGVAAVESGVAGLDARRLAVAAGLAGLRLALLDGDGAEVTVMAADTARDGAGRRFPAHLDVLLTDEGWWHGPERYRPARHPGRPPRPAAGRLTGRATRGPAGRPPPAAAGRVGAPAGRGRAAPAARLRCDCPPECAEDDDGTRPFHTADCVCPCDVG